LEKENYSEGDEQEESRTETIADDDESAGGKLLVKIKKTVEREFTQRSFCRMVFFPESLLEENRFEENHRRLPFQVKKIVQASDLEFFLNEFLSSLFGNADAWNLGDVNLE
jgi:hypothetical protein